MSKRSGWTKLSAPYRARLERHGITRGQWQAGADLRAARGKAPAAPATAAPAELTKRSVHGEATYGAVRDELGTWRNAGPGWLPSRSWMGNDVAAALSQLRRGPSSWEHVTFQADVNGPWTMTVEYTRGHPQTIEIPGGSGAQEVMKMLQNPDAVGVDEDYMDEWEDWIEDNREFEVEGS